MVARELPTHRPGDATLSYPFRGRLLAATLLLAPGLLAAQAPASTEARAARATLEGAAASITSADVARRIGIIAHDSMLGRDTPSRGLELTAQYVADQFRRFGLTPGGEDGGWFQRYAVTRRKLDLAGSRVVFRAGGRTAVAKFDRAARYTRGEIPEQPVTGPAVLLGGTLTPADVSGMPIEGKLVLYAPNDSPRALRGAVQVERALRLQSPKAVVLISRVDSAAFAARLPRSAPERTGIDLRLENPPFVEVTESAVLDVLRAAGVSLTEAREAAGPLLRELPGLGVRLELRDSVLSRHLAPNTIGILEGSDPALKREYVVYSAHMDHIGITPGRADSINNGADDNASGTAGVIELAEAFSRPGARPRRSVVFLTVSGEEKGLWGSRYFSEHPTLPLDDIVANVNIDMIGRNWPDTIVAIGKEHSDLGATLARVNAAHPELGMTAIDDRWPEERFYFRSDHYNFARKGVPVLFFFNGVHDDYHAVTDSPEKIDAEKESRILRLLFYLGQEIANASERPRWNPASRADIVEPSLTP
ncbi:MAG TPA: M20/M25/M40 family metallo-hydrolase [Gemmatimonadales bacterium]|nr:M20/M25/M40 family metallo-hydrolase [Gemmatimonadales bacterium]